ncbi:MAG: acyl-CoA/acyl-ACP dehydrogenase [Spirochaetaceae bacterium]|nr:acyl-CoA/acyl-ACP dehydrogenase [Myxococcales bacterium]MCB9725327.1 acyl-CoA/acyl-ACP dehydrogenase [Spirochaetaceae bacterium]
MSAAPRPERLATSAGDRARSADDGTVADLLERARVIARDVAAVYAVEVDREARFPAECLAALKREGLLSAVVPRSLGGAGLSLGEVATICTILGRACASSAMIYAMHVIQVESIVNHRGDVPELDDYLRAVVREQRLIASVTSEVGAGGDLRRSITHVASEPDGGFRLEKAATTSSYCEHADDLLLSARRSADAAPNDQVLVLLPRGDFELHDVGDWNTLGMRGTCSPPARVVGRGADWQILPTPFRDVAAATMVPTSHTLWAAVWLGLAEDACDRARRHLQAKSRKDPDACAMAASRLATLATRLGSMRAMLDRELAVYEARARTDAEAAAEPAAVLATNDLKIAVSEGIVDVVHGAMQVIGIEAYKNEGPLSLGRHLRDAHSAALMINNDRIRSTNADLLLVYKGGLARERA